jgi:hypothetical protein
MLQMWLLAPLEQLAEVWLGALTQVVLDQEQEITTEVLLVEQVEMELFLDHSVQVEHSRLEHTQQLQIYYKVVLQLQRQPLHQ